jgi:drug/metabolite transporter (DMT)-like permease
MSSEESPGSRRAPRTLVLCAFAAIYVIWGSTYLGIRFAVESLPPFLMGAARFVIAGAALYGFLRWRGIAAPSRADWVRAGISGLLLLGLGNGAVNWAEQKVASSLAALIIAGTPVWFALFDWLRPGGVRPTPRTVLGIVVGFAGVSVLIGYGHHDNSSETNLSGLLVLMLASISWAAGSLYTKYSTGSASTLMTAAQQMLAGGTIMLCMGLASGEAAVFQWSAVTSRSMWAFVYLTVVGSLIAFTAYAWLLTVTTPAKVSTYAYVNPVIAVLLGCLIGGEPLTTSMLVAAGIIVFAVVVLTTRRGANARKPVILAAPRHAESK